MRDILGDMDQKSEQEKNPMRDVQKQTSLPKRFYSEVSVSASEDVFGINLDGKPVKTPGRQVLAMPSEILAENVAHEWRAQQEVIDPAKMPLTRMINTSVDGVSQNPDAVFEEIVKFCSTDMIFYRAQAPEQLVLRQEEAWDPILDWVRHKAGCEFVTTQGIMHIEQPPHAIRAFAVAMRQYSSPLQLTALHSTTTLMGSAMLAFALADGELELETAWSLAHIDEDWNISQWGEDDEAQKRRAFRKEEFIAANLLMEHS